MAAIEKPLSDGLSASLSMRLLMQGKEVGSIIGKKGEIVKRFREESGAKINISDGSCPERVVTVTGTTEAIFSAFKLICAKFEEFLGQMYQNNSNLGAGQRPPITLRLIVPASQCGSLIGKSGSKIKEIREVTGASIQVASEMLPNSTERAVTVSGTADAITQCVYHICCVMLESPPKGATIPYRPKPQAAGGPVILAGGQAYTIQGNYAVPSAPDVSTPPQQFCPPPPPPGGPPPPPPPLPGPFMAPLSPLLAPMPAVSAAPSPGPPQSGGPHHHHHHQHPQFMQHIGPHQLPQMPIVAPPPPSQHDHLKNGHFPPGQFIIQPHLHHQLQDVSKLANSPLSGLLGLGSLISMNPAMSPSSANNTDALAALAGSQLRSPVQTGAGTQTHEMTVPNELIGCIIGKGGTKIAEIRQITGAMITISKYDDGSEDASKQDRTITIKGNADQVALAQYLINTSMELHKAQLDVSKGGTTTPSSAGGINPNAIPLAQLLKNPQALNALSSLTGLQGLTSLTSLLAPDSQTLAAAVAAAQAAQRQKAYQPKLRSSSSSSSANPAAVALHQGASSVSAVAGVTAAAASNVNGSSPKENKRSKFAPY